MTQKNKRRRYEWLLLAVTGLLSIIVLIFSMEVIARAAYTESPFSACLVLNDPITGVRGVPNSVCMEKSFESGWTEYRYNNCGHRAGTPCGPKPPDAYRIVLTGSSLAEGWTVPREQSFAALLPSLLVSQDGRKVELYNEGLEWGTPHSVDLRFDDVLTENPDLILWPITPWDIDHVDLSVPPQGHARADGSVTLAGDGSEKPGLWSQLKTRWSNGSLLEGFTAHSRAFFMLQHLLYTSDSIYLAHSITASDQYGPSIQEIQNPVWESKLQEFDHYAGDIAAKARNAGVPLVVMALPRHAQAVMIASGHWPSDLNPYKFGDQLKAIVEKHGGVYIDVLHNFRDIPNIHSGFYPVDQHLNSQGQRMFAVVIARGLASCTISGLQIATPSTISAANN